MVTNVLDANSTSYADLVFITKLWILCHRNNSSESAETFLLANAEEHTDSCRLTAGVMKDRHDHGHSSTSERHITSNNSTTYLLLQLHKKTLIRTKQCYKLQWTHRRPLLASSQVVFLSQILSTNHWNQQQLVPCELPLHNTDAVTATPLVNYNMIISTSGQPYWIKQKLSTSQAAGTVDNTTTVQFIPAWHI